MYYQEYSSICTTRSTVLLVLPGVQYYHYYQKYSTIFTTMSTVLTFIRIKTFLKNIGVLSFLGSSEPLHELVRMDSSETPSPEPYV